MKLSLATLAFLVPASAFAQTADDLMNEWRECAIAEATRYAEESCHPPSELIPAAFFQCKGREQALKSYLNGKFSRPVAEGGLEGTKDSINVELPSIILKGQAGRCK
ncbi:hypothetical protein GOB43_17845 [Sinorhizobium meliloti]|uniref:hypothetical protein n=1 Tax=Rhizobium meliloti TaxID=382 RepID=UPI000FD51B7E|nr:hypothetical protein [Sinorhizobium meliloti]MDW9519127.1 hypothetical protein [Sinorhizobium meliloti]RVG58474.1 hypothetical protein CN224_15865 [Sinorhizobium meliloti]